MLQVIPLKRPRTIIQWYLERDNLDLSPSYQRRGNLWPPRYKQLLLNSILNQFDIPKIYVADLTYSESSLNENRKPFAVIDGKQRLMTFFSFLSGELRLDYTPVFVDGKKIDVGGFSYSELQLRSPHLARRFEDFTPTVMSVISDSLEDVQELFIRLNLSASISGPERRNAMPGPLPHLIRELSVHAFFRKHASFPISRGQDLNAAAKFLLMESVDGFASVKKEDLDRFVIGARHKAVTTFEAPHARATQTLDLMTQIFITSDRLLSRQALISVYYWLVRMHGTQHGARIREFLQAFEADRSAARAAANARAAGEDVPPADSTLIEYTRRMRSPDDKATQEYLFGVLEERLLAFPGQAELTLKR